MYQVEITPEGRRHLARLPEKIREAVLALVHESLAANPYRVGKPLVGELEGLYSARRAEYRIVYAIDEERRTVVVHRAARRGNAYRP